MKSLAGPRRGKSSALAPPGVRFASFRYKTPGEAHCSFNAQKMTGRAAVVTPNSLVCMLYQAQLCKTTTYTLVLYSKAFESEIMTFPAIFPYLSDGAPCQQPCRLG